MPPTGLGKSSDGSASTVSQTSLPLSLFRRTGMVAVRAEYAAISRQGLEENPAAFAFVEVLAGVGRHRLGFAVAAGRTGDGAGELDHCSLTKAAA
ncbi:hypothetical protein MPLB_210041 [Mesorhizobium sp. ORS 3324]|nr:hypothetical protein MPLB_210041 [Mesorhizobium sp. ORS 3324]